ncbi:MAG: hypothetical protein Q9223_001407 [Gallowayella weberi]
MPFPFLGLPLELQWMVYREIVAPIKVNEPLRGSEKMYNDLTTPEREASLTREAANFLRTCKHINHQASQIFWDKRVFDINLMSSFYPIWGPKERKAITDWQSVGLPPKEYLPQVRNLRIRLLHLTMGLRYGDNHDFTLSENFAVLCHELATHCQLLKSVIIDIPCFCRYDRKTWVDPSTGVERSEHSDCIEPEPLVRLIKPIRRIRVSKGITLQCSCQAMDKIQPVFDNLTAICKSSAAVESYAGYHKVWFDLKEADKSKVKDLKIFDHELSQAWEMLEYGHVMYRKETLEQSARREKKFWWFSERAETLLEGQDIRLFLDGLQRLIWMQRYTGRVDRSSLSR